MNRRDPDVYQFLRSSLAKELDMDVDEVQSDIPFVEMGLDSISGVMWVRKINSHFGVSLSATKVYSHPTLGEFYSHLLSELGGSAVDSDESVAGQSATASGHEDVQDRSTRPPAGDSAKHTVAASGDTEAALAAVISDLQATLAQELECSADEIDEDTPFMELGLDSIIGVTWIRKVNSRLKLSLPASKVYSYPTVRKFAEYLVEEHRDGLSDVSKQGQAPVVEVKPVKLVETAKPVEDAKPIEPVLPIKASDSEIRPVHASQIKSRRTTPHQVSVKQPSAGLTGAVTAPAEQQRVEAVKTIEASNVKGNDHQAPTPSVTPDVKETPHTQTCDIAIIGMSGSFPEAENLHEFWQNILNGKDCVTEVPPSRWSVSDYYDPKPDVPGKSYSKWMGVLKKADKFDPLFFNISPIEAEYMDPQQRLMLQESWRCIEDAGYDPSNLSGTKCGVFIGCSPNGYGGDLDIHEINAHQNLGTSMAILSSRISYYLNLRGPCLSIDTSCSSSLVAIASACDSLLLKNADAALAGGVWVIPGPGLHVAMSQLRALSPDGHCYAFDSRANGFVPAEGVGVIMLKRLEDAQRDNDHIYAVIKGWGVNQDGKSNGITAPNADAQAELQRDIYEKFNINPEHIQLVETHGTGTALGDPVEIDGLTSAFDGYTTKRNYCALTSVKSNIGHTAFAAGVAGVIKAAQSIKHKVLPPTIHYHEMNPHIDLSHTPFYINDQCRPWETERESLRHAAVSSFGYSGTNAHVVLSEAPETEAVHSDHPDRPVSLIVLSARDAQQLEVQAQNLLSYLEQTPDAALGPISYTLLVGRKHFRYRLALVVSNPSELSRELRKWLEKDHSSRVETGHVNPIPLSSGNADLELFQKSAGVCRSVAGEADYKRALTTVAGLYIKGYKLPVEQLFDKAKYRRIPLPTYPFAEQSFWRESAVQTSKQDRATGESRLHPVIHRSTSSGNETSFNSMFGSNDFFMRDHKVGETMVVPGVVYIEMAREAIMRAASSSNRHGLQPTQTQVRLQNVVWLQPGMLNGNDKGRYELSLDVRVLPKSGEQFEYQIVSTDELGQEVVYNQGAGCLESQSSSAQVDLAGLTRTYADRVLTSREFYSIYQEIGLNYGPTHRAVVEVRAGIGEDSLPGVLAKLELSAGSDAHVSGFVLHPSIMDGALQSTMALGFANGGTGGTDGKARLPFSFESLEIYQPTPNQAYAWIRHAKGGNKNASLQKLDISICDAQGSVCVEIKGFSSREFEVTARQGERVTFIAPVWTPADDLVNNHLPNNSAPPAGQDSGHKVVVIGAVHQGVMESIRVALPESVELERIRIDGNTLSERYEVAVQNVISLIKELAETGASRKKLLQVVVIDNEAKDYQTLSGISGLLKTASMEYPSIRTQCIGWFDTVEPHTLRDLICSVAAQPVRDIRYSNGTVSIKTYEKLTDDRQSKSTIALREGGTYLITGGLGGLGRIFAEHIASSLTQAAVILTGRTTPDYRTEEALSSLRKNGVKVEYQPCDIANANSVAKLLAYIEQTYGDLTGIIHAAGTLNDGYIRTKSHSAIRDVLSPKVAGIVNLDEASRHHRLEFFASFSSNVSELGNPGQSDYAAANGFMDAYSAYRDELVLIGQRHGKTLSVNWPLWAEGGMRVDQETEELIRAQGLIPLGTREGIEAFGQALKSGFQQVCVFAGDTSRVMKAFDLYSGLAVSTGTVTGTGTGGSETKTESKIKAVAAPAPVHGERDRSHLANDQHLLHRIQAVLTKLVTEQLKVQPEDIDLNSELSDFGYDSISLTKFANTITNTYGIELTPTIFFEYPTLGSFADYLREEHGMAFAGQGSSDVSESLTVDLPLIEIAASTEAPVIEASSIEVPSIEMASIRVPAPEQETSASQLAQEKELPTADQRVAIIGMSGSFPQADDLDRFWENLTNGVDCITEIPASRWDWRKVFGDPRSDGDKTSVKWGGFIDGVDLFDPLFFNISPREAESMDPQQRLLMTHVWRALEDSGYAPSSLAGSDTAVLIGTAPSGYGNLLVQARQLGESYAATGVSGSVGPNRISFLLDLHGPSEPIETACSSSLVAIHRGAELIRRGDVGMAIVGGVNTIVSPELHISYARAGMLCDDGRCKTFSDQANGYVRGEGVGVLVLKSLAQAEADGDQIYGVIIGSAENHGGRANSLTAPNPNAQAEVIKAAHRQAGIDPSTVTYIEAHGTGTQLGDPVEINALKKAFHELYEAKGSQLSPTPGCGIGSVKSNIGHLELAAGVAGVIKTLLQMKHQTLVKSLHTETINPYIKLEQSPFYILQENRPWEAPQNEHGEAAPRRAGISSFGFGGVNAHVLIEEYIPSEAGMTKPSGNGHAGYPVVLSARSEQQLMQAAKDLLNFVKVNGLGDPDLANLAFTLQVGRDAMEERLATLVYDMEELKKKLEAVCTVQPDYTSWFKGTVKQAGVTLAVFNADQARQEAVDGWIAQHKYEPILDLWVQGFKFDWKRIYSDEQKVKRISLPTYPFDEQRYWVKGGNVQSDLHEGGAVQLVKTESVIHPLVHKNDSNLQEVAFSSSFDGSEFFLADHQVNGQPTLPGVAYLEMAREVAVRANGDTQKRAIAVTGVVWLKPAVVDDQPLNLRTRIEARSNDELSYAIYAGTGQEHLVYSQGNCRLLEVAAMEPSALDLNQLLTACNQQQVTGDTIYSAYDQFGLHYGPAYRAVVEVHCGLDSKGYPQAVAKLSCPEDIRATLSEYVLHPSMIDSALQATLAMSIGAASEKQAEQGPRVPYALDSVHIYAKTPPVAYAWIRYSKESAPDHAVRKLDISVMDADGRICAELNGLSSRVLKTHTASDEPYALYAPEWVSVPLHAATNPMIDGKQGDVHIFVAGNLPADVKSRLEQAHESQQVPGTSKLTFIPVEGASVDQQYTDAARKLFVAIQPLVSVRTTNDTLVQVVIADASESTGGCIAGVVGMLKTVALENPHIRIQLVETGRVTDADALIDIITHNAADHGAQEVRYTAEGERRVKQWMELEVSSTPQTPIHHAPIWKNGGIYLITGGLGKLGLIFATDIAAHTNNATIVLCGRSPLTAENQMALDRLSELGATVDYQMVDMGSCEDVERLVRHVEQAYGTLTAVLHSAGITKDRLLINKPVEELESVLMPKVTGLANLDQATKTHPLDYFICFSSASAELGNPGQSDYAAANAFMDQYAVYRNHLVREGRRFGRTLSINWPLWEEGGMQVDESQRKRMAAMGIGVLRTEQGLAAFRSAVRAHVDQVLVFAGVRQEDQSEDVVKIASETAEVSVGHIASESSEGPATREKAVRYLQKLIANALSLPVDRLQVDTPMERYGIDSMMAADLIFQLEKPFGTLSKTLFFEVQTVRELADYFIEHHRVALNKLLGITEKVAITSAPKPEQVLEQDRPLLRANAYAKADEKTAIQVDAQTQSPSTQAKSTDIAIIGMVGRYPKANNLQEFWNNLANGTDCVTEVPADRWDVSEFFNADKDSLGTTYCKWGGFIDDVDRFDPLFFQITPREAKWMDPQQRLFMEEVWKLLEGSGITQAKIESRYKRRVGVYVGSMYQMYQADSTDVVGHALTSVSSYNLIANRVSHYFGFEGPSVAVDNMCSSSTMAIHLACNALAQGEATLAIAGGVNVTIHPNKYIGLSQAQMIASHPESRSFRDGDGYLPSEGVGAVLLKPLQDAIRDGDNIMAVIKSSSSLHGGRANGFMTPSSKTQVKLIEDSLQRAGLEPDAISYIESAANGSALADAVEINALAKVFKNTTHSIPMGSVKSNLGHPEAASGIAQLTKVVLQLQNKRIAPMVNVGQINPNLDLEHLPFRLTAELEAWETGTGEAQNSPRRALINSIGAGGSYVSLVIEEYSGAKNQLTVSTDTEFDPQLIVLSAKDERGLHKMAENALHYVDGNKDVSLPDLAYTLQLCRNEMPLRLAFVARSVDELEECLASYLNRSSSPTNLTQTVYTGHAETDFAQLEPIISGSRGEEFVRSLVSDRDLDRLAALWVKGCPVDWAGLHQQSPRKIVSLPTYPFERERYWHSEGAIAKAPQQPIPAPATPVAVTSIIDAPIIEKTDTNPSDLSTYLIDFFAAYTGMSAERIPVDKDMHAFGIDSIAWLRLQRMVEKDFGIELLNRELLDITTIHALAACLAGKMASQSSTAVNDHPVSVAVEDPSSVREMKLKMLEDFKNGKIGLGALKKTIRK
ncbi:SDR family NAD(P)-dependent oxidoreductase [Brevibacillus dissolubilis]|uniref:SDR family NAD(P)-dependent oxidoreductase n=1 Tax=Brevibacillus dissolubilis TaxID=1844116 RepID=UPI00159BA556|nr:SDR family NAD(P)-dependent oxidoreductase [Brevibacillus dissolubilis]